MLVIEGFASLQGRGGATMIQADLLLRSIDASWNEARWQTLGDDGHRYEVIDGVLYLTTSPSAFHQWVLLRLLTLVGLPLERRGVAIPFFARLAVFMPGCDPVQPDFMLIRCERTRIVQRDIRGVPDLLAEVASPTTAVYDSQLKRRAYARAGVPEYWIVRPATRDVLVCRQPDAAHGDYLRVTLAPADGELVSDDLGVRVPVAELFAGARDTTL